MNDKQLADYVLIEEFQEPDDSMNIRASLKITAMGIHIKSKDPVYLNDLKRRMKTDILERLFFDVQRAVDALEKGLLKKMGKDETNKLLSRIKVALKGLR